jgi:hypothetical protein
MTSLPLDSISEGLVVAAQTASPTVVLVGGTGLALLIGHRRSDDLDLFCMPSEPLEPVVRALEMEASRVGAAVDRVRTTPGFHRLEIRKGEQPVRVDIAHETAARINPPEPVGRVRVASLRDQRANKMVALLGRSELRDLVDLLFIDRAGLSVRDGFDDATAKDGGMDPAWFAWALGQIRLGPLDGMVEAVSLDELRQFRDQIQKAALDRVGGQV